jgi:hypothetical protein
MQVTEIDSLRDEITRLGIPAHTHDEAGDGACGGGGMCIFQHDETTAFVVDDEGHRAHVDPITALLVLGDLPQDAGAERVWTELADLDHGD